MEQPLPCPFLKCASAAEINVSVMRVNGDSIYSPQLESYHAEGMTSRIKYTHIFPMWVLRAGISWGAAAPSLPEALLCGAGQVIPEQPVMSSLRRNRPSYGRGAKYSFSLSRALWVLCQVYLWEELWLGGVRHLRVKKKID